ncbi:MAG: VapC toxin family PIN domain ribonuclease [Propionibacteriaceae bacterium]|jgi:toxin-antitoxin system PIN domain toxin|nr:VapC toxin family PIN domain ribonuclease [Propionibacteriaceae bacterium]
MTDSHRFLLDANVLVALSLPNHIHHEAAHRWLGSLDATDVWLTTGFTEAAFLRLLMNPQVVGCSVSYATAVGQLQAMKNATRVPHEFVVDGTSLADPALPVEVLGRVVMGKAQVTDFHLLNLAAHVGARLATFDAKLVRCLPPEWGHLIQLINP